MNVCVIGAGPAGLVAARHLSARLDIFNFVVYERSNEIGGQWNYQGNFNNTQNDEVHSSMYKYMRTNLPKEVMGYPDYPFPKDGSSFIHHTEVQNYLLNYTDHFDLRKYIKFNHVVSKVRPVAPGSSIDEVKWNVSVKQVDSSVFKTTLYDSVMVCNGRYSKPHVPDIDGLNEFEGLVMHSHHYRENTPFINKTVVCLGRGPSGMDISLETAKVATKVFISHNKQEISSILPKNMCQISGIASMTEDTVNFICGKSFKVDAVVFCTGYLLDYSFLDNDCQIKVEDNRVTPLYKHYINIKYPSMALYGIPFTVCPFPFFDTNTRFYLKWLSGEMKLPTKEDMYADEAKDFSRRIEAGLLGRYAHHMGPYQWFYHEDLYKLGDIPGRAISPAARMLYDYVHETRVKDLMNYKNCNYELRDDDNFVLHD